MLARYFGLEEDPFGTTPDPRYLYSTRTHREALASLRYAFLCNRGFTTLIAQPGMGKTTLLFEFLRQVGVSARTAFLFNSQSDPIDLLRSILREVGVTPQDTAGKIFDQLNEELVQTARCGKRFVVIVDEAQNLSEAALETLRLLTNFETPRAKLMQIVLSGQPQLADKILSPGLVQLRQRISTFCKLEPFSGSETVAYIEHRLKVAGHDGLPLFTREALDRIVEAGEGIPRVINSLCFNALSLCCAMKQRQVDLAVMSEAIRDLQVTPEPVKQQAETPDGALMILESTEAPEKESWLTRTRVPLFSLILLAAVVIGYWVESGYMQKRTRMEPLSFVPASGSAPAAKAQGSSSVSEKGSQIVKPIEITVDAQQTLSEISVKRLGGFDEQILSQIKELNPDLTNPDLIVPGQRISLPRRAESPVGVHASSAPYMRKHP